MNILIISLIVENSLHQPLIIELTVSFNFNSVFISQVWHIRIDTHVLNHDGSLIDAASIASIAALSHFRRPDVTVIGENVTIVSI